MIEMNTSTVLSMISQYGYYVLFPIAVLEGPIISILGGLLVSLGKLNFFIVYLIIILGDVIGDTMYYALGRWGEKYIRRYGIKIGITEERIEKTKNYFHENHKKAVVISKVAHGIGMAGLVVAGILKIPYKKYIKTCFYITSLQALILLTLGLLFGHAYATIEKYLNVYAGIISVIAFISIAIYAFNKIKSKIKV